MKKIAGLFKFLASSGTALKSKRIFNAYEAGEYTEMAKMLKEMNGQQFAQ
jgi:hypothetical protein